ncbi:MAG TPA: phosphoribosyltransferase [Firmicutes bacterium]|nr:phosphoribosyltransferase [Bacillota bacterium]
MYENRHAAGRALGKRLSTLKGRDVVVLGLLRGGIPVAFEVARELEAPLYPLLPRKIGAPSDPELAIGAVAQDGTVVLNEALVNLLSVEKKYIDDTVTKERLLIEKRLAGLGEFATLPDLTSKVVILVDDGIATGYTMLAAATSARKARPRQVIIAAPVAPREALRQFSGAADEVVVLSTPYPFFAVGQFYSDFSPVSDEEVNSILAQHASWLRRQRELQGRHGPGAGDASV